MIQKKFIDFAYWRPDQPALSQYSAEIVNAIPQEQSFRSMPSVNKISSAMDSRVFRGVRAKDSASVLNNFAGDAGKLYELDASLVYQDVSKAGGYTVTSWEFARFGDRIIAASLEEPIQYFDMGISTLFADLAGSPPKGKNIAIVRDFVVLGNLDDGGTQYPNRVQWSGYNNSESWGVDQGTQADFQDLFGNGGQIQRIVPGAYGVVFQENSIWRMDYSGPPTVFSFTEVERGRGTLAPNSVCWMGNQVFYWGHDGFYAFNGQGSTPIGSEKVDRYVKNRLDTSRYDEMFGAIDRRNNLVVWTYPLVSGGSEIVMFNWKVSEWGRSDLLAEAFAEYGDSGYSLDDLDLILDDIDSESINVDSPEFKGGLVGFGVFTTDHRLGNLTGDAGEAQLTTKEMSGDERIYVSSVRPIVDGGDTATIALGQRIQQNEMATFGSEKPTNTIGEAEFHKDVRYARFRATINGDFSHAQGLDVYFRPGGRR